MKSQFSSISLDHLRYSMVWEDGATMRDALEINKSDEVMIITSAGTNVLNAILDDPAKIHAVDLNQYQNDFLRVQMHIYRHYDHDFLMSFLGFESKLSREEMLLKFKCSMNYDSYQYVPNLFSNIRGHIVESGRLESYIQGFYQNLPSSLKHKVAKLLEFDNVVEQHEYYLCELDNSLFSKAFVDHFNSINLSKGRDPKLFRFVTEDTGRVFYDRLVNFSERELLKENFYFRFFMFGIDGMDFNLLPQCYHASNFDVIAKRLDRIEIITGEAVNYLKSQAAAGISKISFSNIFEYVSPEEFNQSITEVSRHLQRSIKFIFWNLLQDHNLKDLNGDSVNYKSFSQPTSCFYFKNAKIGYLNPNKSNSSIQPLNSRFHALNR